jgi:predicted alpha/beta superfamily hydrolase
MHLLRFCCFVAVVFSCGGLPTAASGELVLVTPDGGSRPVTDGGSRFDAGTSSVDGGIANTDAGTRADAGPSDAGLMEDGGQRVDAGCIRRDTDTPPQAASFQTRLAGQTAWIHDERFSAGYFHTFDAISLGPSDPPRKMHVFLPRSYTTECKTYPVVYFNDGDTTFFPGGAANKTWDVAEALKQGYAARAFGEVIVVAVHPIEREREYTHAAWLPGRACCGLPDYTRWLAETLKPFIDGAYRTQRGAQDTILVGSSHGGLASFWGATTRPSVFGKAIAMSPSFWAGLDSLTSVSGTLSSSALLQASGPGLAQKPRLYLDWGLVRTGGTHNSVIEDRAAVRGREMSGLLKNSYGYAVGTQLQFVEDPAGEHDERSWARRLTSALSFILAR